MEFKLATLNIFLFITLFFDSLKLLEENFFFFMFIRPLSRQHKSNYS